MLDMAQQERKTYRSSNIPNKYELIIVAAKEARRLNELSRQTGLNLGGKVTNVALEEALKGNVLYTYRSEDEELEAAKQAAKEAEDEEEE
jgi:DNA-directed RNA polymerase omega subunit